MKAKNTETKKSASASSHGIWKTLSMGLVVLGLLAKCPAQGTTTFRFEGALSGTRQNVGVYTESGMRFSPLPPGSVFLNGGGVAGYPDNGTGFLEIPDGFPGGMTFGFTNTGPTTLFNLVSFDAAEYAGIGSQILEVVGYKLQVMAPPTTVTNFFSVSSQTFQTFNLDSSFQNIFKVDVNKARWSLDNLVISGVPEPSGAALLVLGIVSAWGFRRWMHRSSTAAVTSVMPLPRSR